MDLCKAYSATITLKSISKVAGFSAVLESTGIRGPSPPARCVSQMKYLDVTLLMLSNEKITTWLLPIVGVLLQAPFTSNQFWETMFSLARWVGNPMASLSYVLWNIRVSGRCAMIGLHFSLSGIHRVMIK